MNGDTHQAPALAARIACVGEKQRVTLTLMPSEESFFVALMPYGISGHLTTMFL